MRLRARRGRPPGARTCCSPAAAARSRSSARSPARCPDAEALLVGTTDGFANIHGPNERVLLDEFEKATVAEADFFARLAASAGGTRERGDPGRRHAAHVHGSGCSTGSSGSATRCRTRRSCSCGSASGSSCSRRCWPGSTSRRPTRSSRRRRSPRRRPTTAAPIDPVYVGADGARAGRATTSSATETTEVQGLLTVDGVRFLFTSFVDNFRNFAAVAIILVVMIGVGLAEAAGLIGALIRRLVAVVLEQHADVHHRAARDDLERRLRRRVPGADPARGGRRSRASGATRWPGSRRRSPGSPPASA